jgi:hypothetical protein
MGPGAGDNEGDLAFRSRVVKSCNLVFCAFLISSALGCFGIPVKFIISLHYGFPEPRYMKMEGRFSFGDCLHSYSRVL